MRQVSPETISAVGSERPRRRPEIASREYMSCACISSVIDLRPAQGRRSEAHEVPECLGRPPERLRNQEVRYRGARNGIRKTARRYGPGGMGRLISGRTACAPALPFPESDAETDDGMRGALGKTTVLPSRPRSVHHSRPHHQAARQGRRGAAAPDNASARRGARNSPRLKEDVRAFAGRNPGVDSQGVADTRNELMDAGNAGTPHGSMGTCR